MAGRSSPFTFTAPPPDADGRVVIYNVSWDSYVAMSDMLGESGSRARLTYLEGTLEIMTNSRNHELLKTLIARLLEAWADDALVDLEGSGSTTFRKKAKERGLEPDECYNVGEFQGVPEIAIEVVISSGLLDKLDVYAGLGVLEVWVFERDALTVYRLHDGAYRTQKTSDLLPALDLAHLASFVRLDTKQSAAVRAYRAELRARAT